MVHQAFKYVVLGGGNASGYAAREFVAKGLAQGELCIITEEPVVAYERPALSKAYLFPEGAARLPGFHTTVGGGGERQDPAWYEAKGITYLTSSRVVAADVAAKTLTLANGDMIAYDKLIVATGARPVNLADFKLPGAGLGGISYLRDVASADALLAEVAVVKAAGGQVVVVGGGYIGMECAAALALHKLPITVVLPETHVMSRIFTAKLAAFYEKFYEGKGVKFMKGTSASAFEGEGGKVKAVLLKDGNSLPADLVVVGVGARPNVELFSGQLEVAPPPVGGLLVDGALRSPSHPDVYVIGDLAAFPLPLGGGKLVRQEHVTHARSSAAHAVAAILDDTTPPYNYLPFFYSRAFNLSWQFYGLMDGADPEPVVFGDLTQPEPGAAPKFGAYWLKEGRVVAAFLEGGSLEENAALKALARERPAAPSPEELGEQGLVFALSRL